MKEKPLIDSNETKILSLSVKTKFTENGIVSRTLLQTPSVRVTLFAFGEGQELTPHTNQRRALVQILEGQCEFLFGGNWQKLERGALVHLPPNDSHAVRATGPFKMLLALYDDAATKV